MATYFHGNPEIQAADGLQTLVLMNPAYVQYLDTPPPPESNLVFLNSNSLSPYAPSPHTQQFVGIPLPATSGADQDPISHDISPLHGLVQRVHYNLYNPINPSGETRESPRAQQGLSLSLSSQQQPVYGSRGEVVSGEDMRVSGRSASSGSGVINGVSGIQSVLLSSKYLKAAQELLDEVVNVNNTGITKSELDKKGSGNNSNSSKAVRESSAVAGDGSGGEEAGGKRDAELTTAERQEIQMKKAKLMTMLDKVDQMYRQYHHEMQIVISTFEKAAGTGSAKIYTALALKTISKQFRCLKDAITGQIRAANKNLGEEDCLGGKIEGSRLKFVDHHLRQQRALQQLGMIQHNAWRPQRGLPERSVSVLRAWLFEHFLHPYPKDSDKHILAKQAGLTRSQVSNWFINARVRLWKPMVEEMYLEEIKEQEEHGSEDKTSKNQNNEDSASKSTAPEKSPAENQAKSFSSKQDNSTNQNASSMPTSPLAGNIRNQSGFSLIGSSELEGITQGSPKKPRSIELLQSPTSVPSINMDIKRSEASNEVSMKFGKDGYSFMGGFGQCPIGEIGRFDAEQFAPRFSGNSVSLTLGLPHCENLSLCGTHRTFLPNQSMQMGRRLDVGEPNEFGDISPSTPHSSAAYENINIQNRKRFGAQLLPDFVA
ncbi:BEL1-like homeodomain protein 1 [Durio zibethinus]|uniref:BEL1-like homeodomain protein 1 n=1 Tax=Durio zibethinus TaxID=66656 RepID=A0A6P5YPM8_DURZI|nr:BEL1-like homeodomain protein 1 [Durio zibethinus]XP_022742243.1 BEL1-like homeodomain protein 1 [Durio zibethinus]XP_022742244.1 BEL1-like homeodomain protein 1 [Durio zibethinus]XP_022742245.1 BEL1-like homeodomain protein 1 [Durio zibethinus]XP_022742246.1 BEL1-like homeodomain protein 1 [Durio zibethinus]